jgi:hypothetical protein
MTIVVRERPPLRLSVLATAPSGRTHRWGMDSPDAEDVPQGLDFSSTIPGGFEQMTCKLARKPGTNYTDLAPLSDLRVEGAGGRCAWEGRLERTPRVSGTQLAINPAAVGWQAALEDDKTVRAIYVDVDMSRWGVASVQERVNRALAGNFAVQDAQVQPDATSGQPSLAHEITNQPWAGPGKPLVEAWYDAGPGVNLGKLYYAWKQNGNIAPGDPNWVFAAALSDDDVATTFDATANLLAAGPGSGTLDATGRRRFANLNLYYNADNAASDGTIYGLYWTALAAYDDHGLPLRGTPDLTNAPGLYASDVIPHAVARFAPLLRTTRAGQSTIEQAPFVIPHLAFVDPTTAAEIVRQANRFTLNDWAVWEDKTFHYHARGGGPTKRWRARVGPAALEETGPQVDRLWNSIMVQYTDVSGVTRTVGPPGSGTDTEDAALTDPDPYNPATLAGVSRRDLLAMGTATPASAIEVGRRFLEQSRLLDTSGRATLVGHVEDDRGVLHPAWAPRASDYITFVDSHDPVERRIVRADYSDQTKTAAIDLDSPPEGLAALLERLSVVLIPLGLT